MPEPIFVLVSFAIFFIRIVTLAMCVRAVLGWFFEPEGKLFHFLFVLTEPVIMPLRKLFIKMNWFQGLPVDVAYAATYLVLFVIELLLSSYLA